jgi:broad specificity phosphatase PhoE
MEIFLVRHGETGGNIAHRHQSDATTLTPAGVLQIKAVSEHMSRLKPTHVLTSSLLRAVESARLIGSACDLIPETNSVFAEIDRPKKLHGHFHKSIGSLWFYFRWYFGLTHPQKEGGESYKALRDRIIAAQKVLETYPNDARIVVVTHSAFINFFLMHLCSKRRLPLVKTAWCFVKILTIPNGAVIKVNFDRSLPEHTCRWSIDK